MSENKIPDEFLEDLYEFASKWVVKHQRRIIDKADDIFNDDTLKKIVEKHADIRRKNRRWCASSFMNAAKLGTEINDSIYDDEEHSYSSVLYDLLVKED